MQKLIVYVLFGGWALLVGMSGLFGHFESGLLNLLFIVVGFGPISLVMYFASRSKAKNSAVFAEALAAAGSRPDNGFDFFDAESGTGMALNREARTLTMIGNRTWKTYPFGDIREWSSSRESGGLVAGRGAHGAAMIVGAAAQAQARSGFFVIVKDIDHPRWRVVMHDVGMQRRWMEILRQEINEK